MSRKTSCLVTVSTIISITTICTVISQPVTRESSSNDFDIAMASDPESQALVSTIAFESPDPESLPPDTFRKLAQALYQRGDKEGNGMMRKYFYNTNVTCNDGSTSGYYVRRNYKSKRWIVFLEGKKSGKRRNRNFVQYNVFDLLISSPQVVGFAMTR